MEDMPDHVKQFVIKDSVTIEGTTENFIWYHSEILRQRMRSWDMDFEKIVRVMESRHKEHIKMLQDVMAENARLKKQLNDEKKKSKGQE